MDTATHLRADATWIEDRRSDESSRFLPLWNLKPLIRPLVRDSDSPELGWVDAGTIAPLLAATPVVVFLGLDGDRACFAIDVGSLEDPEHEGPLAGLGNFADVRSIAPNLATAEDAAIIARARSIIDWHHRHGYCAQCGHPTVLREAGYTRRCGNPECGVQHFPRTDPVVIMVVIRGDQCLLGRSHRFPPGRFSALAGFLEPGETIEEAVRREVLEESGIVVGRVRYHSTQPWPFPSSLMIGCLAEAVTQEITIDEHEMDDVRWFPIERVRAAMSGAGDDVFKLPPPIAIAHQLIKAWLNGESY